MPGDTITSANPGIRPLYHSDLLRSGEANLTGPSMYTDTSSTIAPPQGDTMGSGIVLVKPGRRSLFKRIRRPVEQSAHDAQGGKDQGVIRSLFVSDVHLGCKHAQADEFLELINRFQPENLYIVGDFIDGWKLKNKWRWYPVYDEILQRLMTLKKSGTRLLYTPGNHDSFLRGFLENFGVIELKDRFIHEAGDGRRYVVTHGDQFDQIEQNAQWLSVVASYAYDVLLTANWVVNKLRGKKHDPYAFCGVIKRKVKVLVKHVSEFETQLAEDAVNSGCDGIICGHIHAPRIEQVDQVHYLNTGDWVENCSALIEFEDGSFHLIRRDGTLIDQLAAKPQETHQDPEFAKEQFPAAAS